MLLKQKYGKTPILDVGTFAKIKSGHIKVKLIKFFGWVIITLQACLNLLEAAIQKKKKIEILYSTHQN